MSKYFTAAVETALNFNMITVSEAVELGISEESLQRIENDKVNAAVIANKQKKFKGNTREIWFPGLSFVYLRVRMVRTIEKLINNKGYE